jgi:HEAT repeat protein
MILREFAALRGVAALLKHPDARVRAGAARVLGGQALWPRTSVNGLVAALEDPAPAVRLAAAEALAEAATWTDLVTNAVPALRRLAASAEPAERETYQRVLSRLTASGPSPAP